MNLAVEGVEVGTFLSSQPALNRLTALSTLVLNPFLIRFKIAARTSPSSLFGRRRRTASQKGLQSPFSQAARPSPSRLRSLSHTALAGRRSRRPPALRRRVFGHFRTPPSPVAVRPGRLPFAVVSSVAFAHRPRRSPFAQDPLYSSAQIGIVRVFERCMEVGVDQGLIPGLGMGEIVTAKILVASDELNCLVDEEGNAGSGILVSTSGVEIQLLQMDLHPSCATENDRVVQMLKDNFNFLQIVGEYVNVKTALYQVTGKLRENFFFSLASKGVSFLFNA
nr:KH domain-containing protein HEN4-like [Ipomoea batatas]